MFRLFSIHISVISFVRVGHSHSFSSLALTIYKIGLKTDGIVSQLTIKHDPWLDG